MKISDFEVRKVLASVLKIEEAEIALDASMDTVEAWDSLRQLTFILVLEDEFEIEIPDLNVQYLTSIPLVTEWMNSDG